MKIVDVLIVDDELDLAETTKDYFNALGINTEVVTNSKDFISFFKSNKVKLILLDINLKDASGYDICRMVRETSNIPILFISVRTDDHDKVIALGVGGDDYIEKPYSLSVLVAKVKAMLRRCYEISSTNEEIIKIDDIELNKNSRTLKVKGKKQAMTTKEYNLLLFLIENKNKVITKENLYNEIWGQDSFGEFSTLSVHIRKIREKIESNPSEPIYLKTVWGIGYKFEG